MKPETKMANNEETFTLEYVTELRKQISGMESADADRRAARDAEMDRILDEQDARIERESRAIVSDGTPEQYAAHKAEYLRTARETMRSKPGQGQSVNARELTPHQYEAQKAAYLRNARR